MSNFMKEINSFLSALVKTYNQQGWMGKIVIPGLFLLVFCFLCSITLSLFSPRNSSAITPSPFVLSSQEVGDTPTPLFNFGPVTFTPFPTPVAPTPFPTFTSPPTATITETPTQLLPTATGTAVPSVTSPPPATATATATSGGSVVIIAIDKPAEFVDIQNLSNAPVNLRGWKLVSETGNQSCNLRGTLQPNEVLRIWTHVGNPGISCGISFNIWNDNTPDPAVLYDAQGKEISRYP